jgi:hypothetical protein
MEMVAVVREIFDLPEEETAEEAGAQGSAPEQGGNVGQ